MLDRVGEVSLIPRLWPALVFRNPLDAAEDMVLVRDGAKGLDVLE